MEIDYSVIHLPLHIQDFQKKGSCRFCSKKFEEGYIVSTIKGGYLTCKQCKNKILKYAKSEPNRENLINQKNILSGGSWETNRKKY